jgi:phosphatidate phosphatase LPIN
VNDKTIPFNMKIGEAGEAFFVFETDAEVPEELMTSPILEPTRPGETNKAAKVSTGKFGAKQPVDEAVLPDNDAAQEPEFFELDASAPQTTPPGPDAEDEPTTPTETRPSGSGPSVFQNAPSLGQVAQAVRPDTFLNATVSLGKAVAHAVVETNKEAAERLRDEAAAARNMHKHLSKARTKTNMEETGDQEGQGDEVLPELDEKPDMGSTVVDAGGESSAWSLFCPSSPLFIDVVLDLAGYHGETHIPGAHGRDASERTIRSNSSIMKAIDTPATEPTPELPRQFTLLLHS